MVAHTYICYHMMGHTYVYRHIYMCSINILYIFIGHTYAPVCISVYLYWLHYALASRVLYLIQTGNQQRYEVDHPLFISSHGELFGG